ncbi:MAG: 4Fe-4S dicluster domain-containing protein [Planctomycetota bacterium]|jgi:2-oxoglutarate ferredoxin oxidoreductase subunit delta
MAGKIIIDTEGCKGCGLCVVVCPKEGIVISNQSNTHGYFPAQANNIDCTGCAMCAIICPDAVIEVRRDSKIVSIDSDKKKRLSLTKEKI